MAIKDPLIAGEEFPALPDMTFSGGFFDNGHPPVITYEYEKTDDPFDGNPSYVEDTEKQSPKTAVFASFVG
ncbi:MAG: hypothetical protein II784_05535 [Oscillospiraceae bacterium]|nr:hypothetical protein [Oscillospiraceae bacterium]